MKLLDQYLQAVKFWLPKSQRDDIVREVSGDIQLQIENEEAELGRKLDEMELEAILKRWGQPLLVAERYLPQQCLVGPALYPIYLFVLKIVTLVYLVPWLLVWIGLMVFSPAYRGADPMARISALWTWWSIVLNIFFFVTVGFAYLERFKLRSWLAQEWTPRKLPTESDPNQIPLFSSILEFVLNAVFASWWLNWRSAPGIFSQDADAEGISLAPIWHSLYWPILLLFLAGMVLAIVNLIWPYRMRRHSVLNLSRAGYGLVLICVLLSAGSWVKIIAPDRPPEVARWLNLPILITLVIIGLSCIVEIVGDARRLLKRQTMQIAMIGLAAATVGVSASLANDTNRVEGFFDSAGIKIRYRTEGEGEAVVLIHGFAASAEMWNKVFPVLAKNYRVIALDCRGHGKSDKPHDAKLYGREMNEDIVRLLDHLKITKAHVVGYSMGAEIAGYLLVLHPDRLQSVTLGGGGPAFEPTEESRAKQELAAKSLEEGKGIGPVIISGAPPDSPRPSQEIADAISRMIIGDQDQKALAASIRGSMKLEVTEDELKANRVSVLVVYGNNDGARASQQHLNRIAELLGAEVQVIEGGDHVSTLAKPEFLEAVQSFIKKSPK